MTWSLVLGSVLIHQLWPDRRSVKIDFPYTVVMCIHKSKTVLKVMFSILKKSRCKNRIYLVVEFSRNSLVYVTKKSLNIQKKCSLRCWEAEMLRNQPLHTSIISRFLRDFNTFMGNWHFRSFIKSFCPARPTAACSDVMYNFGIRKRMIVEQVKLVQNIPSTVSSEVYFW